MVIWVCVYVTCRGILEFIFFVNVQREVNIMSTAIECKRMTIHLTLHLMHNTLCAHLLVSQTMDDCKKFICFDSEY